MPSISPNEHCQHQQHSQLHGGHHPPLTRGFSELCLTHRIVFVVNPQNCGLRVLYRHEIAPVLRLYRVKLVDPGFEPTARGGVQAVALQLDVGLFLEL